MHGLKPGTRVQVDDPGLAKLRDILRRAGHEPAPNHHGIIAEVWDDGDYLIHFDDGMGAPYPAALVRPVNGDDDEHRRADPRPQ